MRKLTSIVGFLLLFVFSPADAHEPSEGKVTALLGPFLFKTNFPGAGTQYEAPLMGGAGLIVEGDIDTNGGLELTAFYLNKIYVRSDNDKILAERIKQIYISMGYRHWFNKLFSIGGAFFSSYIMGKRHVEHSEFNPPNLINTSASDTTEYGFDFSVQYEFWKHDVWAAALDVRYSLSVTTKPKEYGDHYGALIGIKYQIQEKFEDRND